MEKSIQKSLYSLNEQNLIAWNSHTLVNDYFHIEECYNDIRYSMGCLSIKNNAVEILIGKQVFDISFSVNEGNRTCLETNLNSEWYDGRCVIDNYEMWYNFLNEFSSDILLAIPLIIQNKHLYFAVLSFETRQEIYDLHVVRPFLVALLTALLKNEFLNSGVNNKLEHQESVSLISNHAALISFENLEMPYIEIFHRLSNIKYEGSTNYGMIHFVKDRFCNATIDFMKKDTGFFDSEIRTLRKYLQVSTKELPLIARYKRDYEPSRSYWFVDGYGLQSNTKIDATIRFMQDGSWECTCDEEKILYNGHKYLISEKKQLDKHKKDFKEKIKTEFKGQLDQRKISTNLWTVTEYAKKQLHGTLLIFMTEENIKIEVNRFSNMDRAISIKPFDLSNDAKRKPKENRDIVKAMTSIDGAMMIDLNGCCHAIGVILDGSAKIRSNKGRGARYNSALAYVYSRQEQGMNCAAVIISEDGMNDVIISKQIPEVMHEVDLIEKRKTRDALRLKDRVTCGCCGKSFPAGIMKDDRCPECADVFEECML